MSFFLKGKPRNAIKRKFDSNVKKSKKNSKPLVQSPTENDNESIDSDLEFNDVPDRSESEGEYETAQEKKIRLAKKYLEEIARVEKERTGDDEEVDDEAVSRRLQDDNLEKQGRLRRNVADSCCAPSFEDILSLRCRETRLSITCTCVTGDGTYLFVGSKCASIVKWQLSNRRKIGTIHFKKDGGQDKKFKFHKSAIASLAVSTDGKFLASCDRGNDIQTWDADTLQHLRTLQGHRGAVTDLVFRRDSHQLFSASADRCVKVWSLDEMAYVETLFGHQAPITSIDALSRERALTAGGRDCTLRIWKIPEESQLIFNGHTGSIDGVKLIDEEHFVSYGDDGSLCVWGTMRKKPLCSIKQAHGADRWLTAVAALRNSDLIASGSSDGFIRLWKLNPFFRNISPLFSVPVKGFVNCLSFTPDGQTLIAGVGQEHKLGRWWKQTEAKNVVYLIPIIKNS